MKLESLKGDVSPIRLNSKKCLERVISDLKLKLREEKEMIVDAWHNGFDRNPNTTGITYYNLHYSKKKNESNK